MNTEFKNSLLKLISWYGMRQTLGNEDFSLDNIFSIHFRRIHILHEWIHHDLVYKCDNQPENNHTHFKLFETTKQKIILELL